MPPSIDEYRLRLANLAVGPTTLRNQGAPGVAKTAREFLSELNLKKFVHAEQTAFAKELDRQTILLMERLPKGAQHWGTARKAINIFLGEAYYHQFVCRAYGLERVETFLEVPLDSQVGDYLTGEARKAGKVKFPQWLGIKYLDAPISKQFQDFALEFAESLGVGWARIHLDVKIWGR